MGGFEASKESSRMIIYGDVHHQPQRQRRSSEDFVTRRGPTKSKAERKGKKDLAKIVSFAGGKADVIWICDAGILCGRKKRIRRSG